MVGMEEGLGKRERIGERGLGRKGEEGIAYR